MSSISRVVTAAIAPLLALSGIAATVGAQSYGTSPSSSSSVSSSPSPYSMMSNMAYSSVPPLSSGSFAVSSQPTQMYMEEPPVTFKDVPDDAWYAEHVKQAARARIVNGYKDTTGNLTGFFGPDDKLTVAQSVKVALESAGYEIAQPEEQVIAMGGHWSLPYMDKARQLNFAMTANATDPDRPATRAEMASLFTDAFRVAVAPDIMGAQARFKDLGPQIVFAQAIDSLSRDGVLSGDTDPNGNPTGTVRPNDTIVRAEAVKMAVSARTRYGLPGSVQSSVDTSMYDHSLQNSVMTQ